MSKRVGRLYGIGALARRTGLSVRTIRFWSDSGLVPPTQRSAAGHRLFDAAAMARLELVATLRQLDVGLDAIRSVLARKTTIAAVAGVHARAIEAEIEALRVRRAVLVAIAEREPTTEEMRLMHDVARMSAVERQRLVDDFVAETFGDGAEPSGLSGRMQQLTPALPENPTAEQVRAWIDVAELLLDPGFRDRVREMADAGRGAAATDVLHQDTGQSFYVAVTTHAGAALAGGVDPGSIEAERIVQRILPAVGLAERAKVAEQLATFTDSRVDRYWRLVGVVNGWPEQPSHLPAFQWLQAALHARGEFA